MDWDNTARYKKRATLFKGASPERFGYWMSKLIEKANRKPENERLIFLNAWNEWAEGAYLEPDERYGYAYLEQIANLFATLSDPSQTKEPIRKHAGATYKS